jgi:hypothetical protein
MPAEFLIAPDGTIMLSHYAKDFGDYLPLSDIYRALEEYSSNAATVSV